MIKKIICHGGPVEGHVFEVSVKNKKCTIPLHSNPFYSKAIYSVTNRRTLLGEYVALFLLMEKR